MRFCKSSMDVRDTVQYRPRSEFSRARTAKLNRLKGSLLGKRSKYKQ